MRLLPSEHTDIMNLLKEARLENDVLLTKKTGWVHLKYKSETFSFHRKKVTQLENGRFVDSVEYYTGSPRQPEKADSWSQVARMLHEWTKKASSL
jgi:phage pi2 protein 07